jgi:hypothetical protein
LRTLLSRAFRYLPYFQQLPHSFRKTPGVGIPLRPPRLCVILSPNGSRNTGHGTRSAPPTPLFGNFSFQRT